MEILSYSEEQLKVKLLNGRNCTYFGVPLRTYMNMINAESPLKYFNENIWGSRFEHEMEWESLDSLLEIIADILLVDHPIGVNERPHEDTPLHIATVWGDVRAVSMLIAAGAELNTKGDMSCTPLYNAVSFEHVRCAELLIDAGATLDDENELSITARESAMSSGNANLIRLFKNA